VRAARGNVKKTPVIIDYGSGNIRSVVKSFEYVNGGEVLSTSDPLELEGASHIVLPGVGTFADCKAGLKAFPGLVDALIEQVIGKKNHFLEFVWACN